MQQEGFFGRWEMVDLALGPFVLVAGPPMAALLVGEGKEGGGGSCPEDTPH